MLAKLLLFAGFVALTTAQINYCQGNKATIGHCTTLTYTDVTSTTSDPPSSAECQDACRGVLTDAGDWGVNFKGKPDGYVQHMVGYPCGFSVGRDPSEPKDYDFLMDNQDIVDILDEVSKRFAPSHGGRVAATGTMECDGKKAIWYVD